MTAPLSEERLAEITALEAAATAGPWHTAREAGTSSYPPDFVANWVGEHMQGVGTFDTGVGEQAEADLEFILDARTAVPQLLAEVARQRKIINRLTNGAGDGARRVRMYETASGTWKVRWLFDGNRKGTACATETEARDLVDRLKGGAR
jgi:hypothetical protein